MHTVRLTGALLRANRRLTLLLLSLATAHGLMLPGLAVATGALVGAVGAGNPAGGPLVVLALLFVVQRVLDPITWELSVTLWRQLDESLLHRVMGAMVRPPGLAHMEDPTVLDRVAQAQGALTDITPGEAATRLNFVVRNRVMAATSLAIVASFRWWAALLLAGAYAVSYRATRWHWDQVTLVIFGRTDELRRAYYLRRLALTPDAAKETRVFDLASWLVDRYRREWLDVMARVWSKRREGWVTLTAIAALLAVAEGVVLVAVARAAAGGSLSVGTAITVGQAVLAAALLGMYMEGHWVISEGVNALDRIDELERSAATATVELAGTRPATGLPRQAIRFERVGFTYPGRTEPVFEALDLEIRAGSSLAIVGQNGAGKTTLVKLLARLHDPSSGRITVDGIDLRELDPKDWRTRIAAVFQDYVQFELSAYDNVALGSLPRAGDRDLVIQAATLAGTDLLVKRLPDEWETVLSRAYTGGTDLSGGEWQRLALARAMFAVLAGAEILILDEPTASMDVRAEADVYDRFLDLTRGLTTIVISHRFSTVRRADRIVVVEGGRVVEDGSHDQLLAAGGRYSTMYRLQAARFQREETAGA
ncbi:MAG: ABC transporter ATP-binding protein/permease [Actinomycetota bacterium]|nr:ABC transporter ATP-binding protein/permease [Actinomycetota bacterium]